jgi:tetratricopeptide (TPR) repeat protein
VALSSGIKNLCWKRGGDKRNFQLSSFKSFPIVPRPFSPFRLLASILALALIAGWSGCGDSERFSYASEADEPSYREGTSLLKAGRRQEALTAFLKVIDKRRDDAPESHLEVGLLYAQHINDPLSAIYHFRKYLALRPNSPQAPLVRQRIDAAIRDFARTLPAQPLDGNQPQRVDLVATLDRLKQENESLKQQLADARANRVLPALAATPEVADAAPAGEGLSFSVDALQTVPTVRTRPAPTAPTRPAATTTPPVRVTPAPITSVTSRPAAPAPTIRTTPPAPTVRRHTIRPGDTLSKLAQQYYNNRAKWRDIYAANRDVMKSESDLKAGMVLKIP